MRELALHVLDLVQNSVEAGAGTITLEIVEDTTADRLVIRVTDNGRGMDQDMQRRVRDPFVTTRTTRRVGLGLPLIDMSTRHCGGYLRIQSEPGQGTVIEASYVHSHIDRPPLGNMVETIKSIMVANSDLDFCYSHTVNHRVFSLSLGEIREQLGGIPLTHPDVLVWVHEFLTEQMANLYGGAKE